MRSSDAVLLCTTAQRQLWQLGPLQPPIGQTTLIGWRYHETTEAGVPAEIAHVLIDALLSLAELGFLFVQTPPLHSEDTVRHLRPSGLRRMLAAVMPGLVTSANLVSTRRAETAEYIFSADGFPWTLQGQMGILGGGPALHERMKYDELSMLISDDWATVAATMCSQGALGVLRPGVDGDVIGLFTLSDDVAPCFAAALERATVQAKGQYACLSEDAFMAALKPIARGDTASGS